MANEKRKTQKEMFAELRALAVNAENMELVEFVDSRVALLEKKSGSRKPTKTQEENENIKNVIVDTLGVATKAVTVTELQGMSEVLGGLSNQRVSALLRQLIDCGKVSKTVDKKKSFFALTEGE